MPKGVKKTEDSVQTSENNVTVNKEIESNISDSIQNESSGSDKSSELKKSTTGKSKKSEDKVEDTKPEIKVKSSEKSKKSEDTVEDIVEDRFYYIVRPVPMYLSKNVSSPMLALVSGKCRIRSKEDDWIKITIGVPEKGSTTGYIQKFGAIIR